FDIDGRNSRVRDPPPDAANRIRRGRPLARRLPRPRCEKLLRSLASGENLPLGQTLVHALPALTTPRRRPRRHQSKRPPNAKANHRLLPRGNWSRPTVEQPQPAASLSSLLLLPSLSPSPSPPASTQSPLRQLRSPLQVSFPKHSQPSLPVSQAPSPPFPSPLDVPDPPPLEAPSPGSVSSSTHSSARHSKPAAQS